MRLSDDCLIVIVSVSGNFYGVVLQIKFLQSNLQNQTWTTPLESHLTNKPNSNIKPNPTLTLTLTLTLSLSLTPYPSQPFQCLLTNDHDTLPSTHNALPWLYHATTSVRNSIFLHASCCDHNQLHSYLQVKEAAAKCHWLCPRQETQSSSSPVACSARAAVQTT